MAKKTKKTVTSERKFWVVQKRDFVADSGSDYVGTWCDWQTIAVFDSPHECGPATPKSKLQSGIRRVFVTTDIASAWEYDGKRDAPKSRRGRISDPHMAV